MVGLEYNNGIGGYEKLLLNFCWEVIVFLCL